MRQEKQNKTDKKLIKLSSTRAWRTYSGGKMIDEMHGKVGLDSNFPEEWVASCVEARNKGREDIVEGLSQIEGTKITLKSLIDKNPIEMLGKVHYEKHGSTMGVLTKIIDSSERLTIQCHPTREMAMKYLNSKFGKTESWYILGGREIDGEKPCIYMGFKKGVTKESFIEKFENQDLEGMLDTLHKIEVNLGDVYLIEGGVPHAIGKGCFLLEVQEPTDYTLRVEKTTPAGLVIEDEACHQGVGFKKMFEMFDFDTYTKEEVKSKWKIPIKKVEEAIGYSEYDLIKEEDTDCFSMKKVDIREKYILKTRDTFSVLKVTKGRGTIKEQENITEIKKGDEFFVPANLEKIELSGKIEMIICYPPSY